MQLEQLLKNFDAATIKRSREYIYQFHSVALDQSSDGSRLSIRGKVRGSGNASYQTHVQIRNGEIYNAACSCPVDYYCKHAAALIQQVWHQERLNAVSQTVASVTQPSINKASTNKPSADTEVQHTAQRWLESLRRGLATRPETVVREADDQSSLIYLLSEQYSHSPESGHLLLSIEQVTRKKNGTLSYQPWAKYDSAASLKKISAIDLSIIQRLTLHRKQMTFYSDGVSVQNMDAALLQQIARTQRLYWHTNKNQPLQWQDAVYRLAFEWHEQAGQIQLVPQWSDAANQPIPTHQQPQAVMNTLPLSYLHPHQGVIGQVDSAVDRHVVHHLLTAPSIPQALFEKLSEVLSQYKDVALPRPKTLELPEVHGTPVGILRFDQFNHQIQNAESITRQLAAEVHFEYPAGSVLSGEAAQTFKGRLEGQSVLQHRDLTQEKKLIQQLEPLSRHVWLHRYTYFTTSFRKSAPKSYLLAQASNWLRLVLMPAEQLQQLGWKIEQGQQSPLQVQKMQRPQIDVQAHPNDESGEGIDWFGVGMKIQTEDGQQYDLIELLSGMVERYPELLEPDFLAQYTDEQTLPLIAPNGVIMLFRVGDIRPIVSYLFDLMSRERVDGQVKLDQYDALRLLDLQHVLGMQWAGTEGLQRLHQQFKQGVEQQLPTPDGFMGELRHYQQQGLAWLQFLRQTEHAGILADDMGLGKTAQTLAHIQLEKNQNRLDRPVLIVAPTSLMGNWRQEAEKFTPELKVLTLHGADRAAYFDQIKQHDLVLTTYPLLARDEAVLQEQAYHLLILDEAQNIKNPRTKMAHAVRQLSARHRLCLTGTPMENHLGELWSLYHFLMPGFLGDQTSFNKRYRTPIEKHQHQHVRQALAARVRPFMLRRRKTEVAKELPPKTVIEVAIEMHPAQQKLYEAVRACMQASIAAKIAEKGFQRSQIEILDALLKLRQVCCHPSLLKLEQFDNRDESAKLDRLLEMVQELVEEGRRILIFSQFTTMLSLIETALQAAKIATVKLTGQTKKRAEVVEAFQQGDIPVFLISLKAGGTGLNLTAADTVIHYDPWWNPAAEDQASDRAWRIGQDKPVFVYKLITQNSIEEKILQLQQRKAKLSQGVLSEDTEKTVKFDEQELANLLGLG